MAGEGSAPSSWRDDGHYITEDGGPPPHPPPPAYHTVLPPVPPQPFPFAPGAEVHLIPVAFLQLIPLEMFPSYPHLAHLAPSPPPPPPPPPPHSPDESSYRPAPSRGLTMNGASGPPPGMNYLYPQHHTCVHLLLDAHLPWENPGKEFSFKLYTPAICLTIRELIHQLGTDSTVDETMGLTECLEVGDGAWLKGSTFLFSDARSKQTLAAVGWDQTRGLGDRRPVWVTLHEK